MATTPEQTYAMIREALADTGVAAIVSESVLEPMTGPGSRIAPPTYVGAAKGSFTYAFSEGFLPAQGDDGWHSAVVEKDGRPEPSGNVVVDAVQSQANRVEEAIWELRDELGGLPGIVVSGEHVKEEDVEKLLPSADKRPIGSPQLAANQITNLVRGVEVSSWTASHRQADALLRYAAGDETGNAAWTYESDLRALIESANATRDATSLYRNFPNSLLFGFWLSSGVVERHRQARIYSSEIVGYGAHESVTGASKIDTIPASSKVAITPTATGFTSEIKTSVPDKSKPSAFGFGMVPNSAEPRGFVCELILRRASIALSAVRAVPFADDIDNNKNRAASAVLVSLALLGHHVSSLSTQLRSGCDLLTVETRYGLRRIGQRATETIEVPGSTEDLIALVRLAITEAEAVGLSFAKPVKARLSDSEVQQIVKSAVVEAATKENEGAE